MFIWSFASYHHTVTAHGQLLHCGSDEHNLCEVLQESKSPSCLNSQHPRADFQWSWLFKQSWFSSSDDCAEILKEIWFITFQDRHLQTEAPEFRRHSPKICCLSVTHPCISYHHHWASWNCCFFFLKSVKSIQNFKCTSEDCKGNNLLQFPLTENRIGWVIATQIDSSFLSSPWCPQLKGVGCAIANLWSTPQPVSGWAAVQRWEEVKW